MVKHQTLLLSVVVPLYNEREGLEHFHRSLLVALAISAIDAYEIIYCDDGSSDDADRLISVWHRDDPQVKLIKFSRNFGKENALSAGIAFAKGQAVIMLDGDGQHPPRFISDFVEAWREGAQVVLGVRTETTGETLSRRVGSKLFYGLFNKFARQKLIPGSTDFQLIDRAVQKAFLSLPESQRITRGLIDWLGFKRKLIYFQADARANGSPGYSFLKLIQLAMNSFVSLTLMPLYIFGCLGVFITAASLLLGSSVVIEQLLLGDPWHWRFTGTAMLAIVIVFLIGIVLLSQGILSLYISHIHQESKRRPLYVIDEANSVGIKNAA